MKQENISCYEYKVKCQPSGSWLGAQHVPSTVHRTLLLTFRAALEAELPQPWVRGEDLKPYEGKGSARTTP